jgi:hypothetical protein
MVTNMRMSAWPLAAPVLAMIFAAGVRGATPDRIYRFGEDPMGMEQPTLGGTPNSTLGPLTLDTQVFNTVNSTDASHLSFSGEPSYFNAGSGTLARPGAAAGSFGLQFDGANDVLFLADRGLGVPAEADENYGSGFNNAPGYTNITTRYIDGWVRPTGGAGARRDIVNDTERFGIFIGANNNWGFVSGTTTVNSSTPAALNTWTHVMHRTFGANGGAVLYVNGIAVAATPNGYSTGFHPVGSPNLAIVFGAGLNQTSNFYQGQLDEFLLGVAGNNTGQAGGRDYGAFNLATDNQFVAQNLTGVDPGDINRDGMVNSTDVNTFVSNWRRIQQVNGVTVGDLNSRLVGDLNMNGTVDIDDAYTLHFALRSGGVGAGLDFSLLGVSVPEPGSVALLALAGALVAMSSQRCRRTIVEL